MQCFVYMLCGLSVLFSVAARRYTPCFGQCRCSDNGKNVICSSLELRDFPHFSPAKKAGLIEVLALQRNQLTRLDGWSVSRQLPALRTIDLRDQDGRPCVLMESPFPTEVKVIGKLFLLLLFYFFLSVTFYFKI